MSTKLKGDYFTVADIALARNITPQGVRKALREKRLLGKKIAGSWFITDEELMKRGWL